MPLNDPIGSSAADVLVRNASDLDKLINSSEYSVQNRVGDYDRTISGINQDANDQIARLGFEQPISYNTSGQTLLRVTQTVTNGGLIYAPAFGTAFPFVTSGAFNSGLWRVISTVDVNSVISATQVNNVAALRLFSPVLNNQQVYTAGKLSINDGLAGDYVWDSSSVLADDGYRVVKVTALTTGRFLLLENKEVNSISELRSFVDLKDGIKKTTLFNKIRSIGGSNDFFFDSSSSAQDNNGSIIKPNSGTGRWLSNKRSVSALQFGALGDGSGNTPTDTADDISAAVWNVWPSFITGASYLQQPGHDWGDATYLSANKPFKNTDTWDFIGCQLALWSGFDVSVPSGNYILNQPLRYTNTMRNSISSPAMYSAIFKFKNINTHLKIWGAKCLFDLYRIGGVPTIFNNISIIGESGYSAAANPNFDGRLVGILHTNTNGVHFNDGWIAGGLDMAFDFKDYTGDCFVNGTTTEFCGTSFAVGTGCDITVNDCNVWQSYAAYVPCSVVLGTGSGARITIDACRAIGYSGNVLSGIAVKCSWSAGRIDLLTGGGISLSSGNTISNVDITLQPTTGTPIQLLSKSNFLNNNITAINLTHAIINIGAGFANDTSLVKVTGNTIDITGTFAEGGLLVTSIVNGASYTGAATKCLFSNNVIYNQALATIGLSGTNTVTANQFGV